MSATTDFSSFNVKIGVIGGTGVYSLPDMTTTATLNLITPYGQPSSPITIVSIPNSSNHVAFISRHGPHHAISPSTIPYRANIAALRHLGCELILSITAVGSLREEIHPRDVVIPSQVIDRTKGVREFTFFNEGIVAHMEFGDPFSADIASVLAPIAAKHASVHTTKTLVVMEGPCFSTRAESFWYRQMGADIINMTTLPEAKLAREAGMLYQPMCMSTDYDCWKGENVTVEQVIGHLTANGETVRKVLGEAIIELDKKLKEKRIVSSFDAKNSIVTKKEGMNKETIDKLKYIGIDF